MNIKTFITTDGENALDFGSTKEKYYWCKNVGQTALYISDNANVKADGDGVALLNANEAVMIENYDNFIYVLGAGKIEVYETESETCPFKSSAQGGSGADEVARAAIEAHTANTDIHLTAEQLNTAVAEHNADASAHPSILSQISEVKSRVLALEIAGGAEVTANPFAVTFGNLDGITANAVWNADEARLEF